MLNIPLLRRSLPDLGARLLVIDLRPAPRGQEGRAHNIHKSIVNWLSNDAVFIDRLVGEDVLDVVCRSFLVLVGV